MDKGAELLKFMRDELTYGSDLLIPDIKQIKATRYHDNLQGFDNYADKTKQLLCNLHMLNNNNVVNNKGQLKIHLYPPTDKLELGEFYFQAGISQPGTLAIKFGKLNQDTQRCEESQATLENIHYQKCFCPDFFKEFRARAAFAGDCLFRICLIRDSDGSVKKVETKQLLIKHTKKLLKKSVSAPTEPENWPQMIIELDSATRRCMMNGLAKPTYLPGKDHLSFARKLGYSEEEVLHFDDSKFPAESIIEDLVQSNPKYDVSTVMDIFRQMGRQDIILACRQLKGPRNRMRLGHSFDASQLSSERRQKALSDPPPYVMRRGLEPVESSEEEQPSCHSLTTPIPAQNENKKNVDNPSYPPLDQAVSSHVTTNTANASYPSLTTAVSSSGLMTHSINTPIMASAIPCDPQSDNASYPPLTSAISLSSSTSNAMYPQFSGRAACQGFMTETTYASGGLITSQPQDHDQANKASNTQYPLLQNTVREPDTRQMNQDVSSSIHNGKKQTVQAGLQSDTLRHLDNIQPESQTYTTDQEHNQSYPSIGRAVDLQKDVELARNDSMDDHKKHMQPETDLSLPELD